MYQFVTGPLLWLSFAVFLIGSLVHVVRYFRGLDWKLDRVAYREYPVYGIKGALRSILFWLVPFGTRSWRVNPGMTVISFTFHLGLLITPIFLTAHAVLLKERWGLDWPAISNPTADVLSGIVIAAGIFLILRRIGLSEVRVLTTIKEYLAVAVAIAPFVTGLIAAMGGENYRFWLILHILSGELWLVAIPFTKLSHVVLFFCSRAQIGMDFGIKRGGMKCKGMAW